MCKKFFIDYSLLTMLLLLGVGSINAQQTNRPIAGAGSVVPNSVLPDPYPNGMTVSYVRTWEPISPITSADVVPISDYQHVKQSTLYVDGLGRPLQTVQRQISPAAKDLVAPVVYDQFGRESKQYLPYVSDYNTGLFKAEAFIKQAAFMKNQIADDFTYAGATEFEPSPRNRVVKTMAAGNSWAGSGRGITMEYMVNNRDNDAVRIWDISNDPLPYGNNKDVTTNIPVTSNLYNTGELYKTVNKDEGGNVVVEYRDKEGQLILKKVQVGDIAISNVPGLPGLQNDLSLTGNQNGFFQAYKSISLEAEFESGTEFTAEIVDSKSDYSGYTGFLSTYYVYDAFNQLRFVIPPKAVAQLLLNNWQITPEIINELCFRYEYDERKRMIAKKVPGADWVYMIYDIRDRLVFSQDGNMRSGNKGQWMATLYDALNRPVMTGMIAGYTANRDVLQSDINNRTATNAGLQVTIEGMPVNASPLPAGFVFTALTKTYYDKYDWTNKTYSDAYNNYLDAGNNLHPLTMPTLSQKATTGMVTGTQVRVVSDPGNLAAGNWLTTVSFYDDRNRSLQVQAETLKGIDIVTSRYDFSGKMLSSYLHHTNSAGATPFNLRVKTSLEYDHAGRVKEVWKVINDEVSKKALIAKNEYNELGQLVQKALGHKKERSGNYTTIANDPLEVLDYTYNIRGWLTGINKDYANGVVTPNRQNPWFGMELNYDKGFDRTQFNGNISGTKWRSKGDDERRAFGYTYDKANRLLGAYFTQFNGSGYQSNPTINFNMKIGDGVNYSSAYDENGNILAMTQMGLRLKNSEVIDDLRYEYYLNGNKLKSVLDITPPQAAAGLGDFQDINTGSNDYGYDVNGNLVTDKNKKLNGVPDVDQANGAIVYNHLNLPWQINVDNGNKGTITYNYDAAGVKLQKIVLEKGVTVVNSSVVSDLKTTTNYVGGLVYESKEYLNPAFVSQNYIDKLQFVNHEEGRMRYIIPLSGANPRYEYDYFVKDHLGNVRMVLTEEQKQDIYPAATLEGDLATSGTAVFTEKDYYNIDGTYIVDINATPLPGLSVYQNNNGTYNPNPNSDVNANSQKLYKLNAATNKTGLGISLKVMVGDQIDIMGKSYWFNNGGNYNDQFPIPVDGIIDAFVGSPGMIGKGLTTSGLSPYLGGALNMFKTRTDAVNAPWAYINWIFFDEQFNYAGGGFRRISSSVGKTDHTLINEPDLVAPKNGYVFVYCSNESAYDVYFDNIQVFHNKSALVEETHYYPFGLTMAGISSKAATNSPENKYKFNGIEQTTELGLNQYDAFFRNLDPQIGRFWQIDPKAIDEVSPYVSMLNNPLKYCDPLGDTTTYYDEEGSVLYQTNLKGYRNAFIVNNNSLDVVKQFFAQVGSDLNSAGQFLVDAAFSIGNRDGELGDAYDLQSISKFYEQHEAQGNITGIDGHSVESMTSLSVNGKPVTKGYINSLKGAEYYAQMKKVNGVWTVDFNTADTKGDMTRSYISGFDPYIHIHNYTPQLLGKTLEYTAHTDVGNAYGSIGPMVRSVIPSHLEGDVGKAKGEGKKGSVRNMVVNYSHIWFYNGESIGFKINRK